MKYSKKKPTKPGWYWCRNAVDDAPSGEWEAVVHVMPENGTLVARWMGGHGAISDGRAYSMNKEDWSPDTLWAGPLKPPCK